MNVVTEITIEDNKKTFNLNKFIYKLFNVKTYV